MNNAYRLSRCPAGFIGVRTPLIPQLDHRVSARDVQPGAGGRWRAAVCGGGAAGGGQVLRVSGDGGVRGDDGEPAAQLVLGHQTRRRPDTAQHGAQTEPHALRPCGPASGGPSPALQVSARRVSGRRGVRGGPGARRRAVRNLQAGPHPLGPRLRALHGRARPALAARRDRLRARVRHLHRHRRVALDLGGRRALVPPRAPRAAGASAGGRQGRAVLERVEPIKLALGFFQVLST